MTPVGAVAALEDLFTASSKLDTYLNSALGGFAFVEGLRKRIGAAAPDPDGDNRPSPLKLKRGGDGDGGVESGRQEAGATAGATATYVWRNRANPNRKMTQTKLTETLIARARRRDPPHARGTARMV